MRQKLLIISLVALANICFGQSKPLDLSITLSDLNNYQLSSEKGQPNGYAPLESNSLIQPQFLFPNFATAPNGTFWSKSGSSWGAISNLNVQSSGLVASLVRIGQLSIPGSSLKFGLATELNNVPLVLYGGSGRVYISSGQTIGAADVGFNNFNWSINSSGNFDLNGGVIKGGLSMNNGSISNISSINSLSGLSINLTNNRIISLVPDKDIIISGNSIGLQVPNIDTNELVDPQTSTTVKSYALNMNSADMFYALRNNTNTWSFPQTFLSGVTISPALSINNGGTGATNAAQARQNLGITAGTTNGFQAWSPILANLSTNTPINNNFMVGSVSGLNSSWTSRTPEQVKTILGLNIGSGGVQPYSSILQYIVNTATNNTFTSRYFIVGDPTTSSLVARSSAQTRSDLGLEINSVNGVQAYSVYLRDIANLGIPQVNEFLVGSGSTWVKRSATQTRDILSAQPANTTLSNVANSSYTGDNAISLVGTITSGTWNGTTIAISSGGTGATNVETIKKNLGLYVTNDVEFNSAKLNLLYFSNSQVRLEEVAGSISFIENANQSTVFKINGDTNPVYLNSAFWNHNSVRESLGFSANLSSAWTASSVSNFTTAIGLGTTGDVIFDTLTIRELLGEGGVPAISLSDLFLKNSNGISGVALDWSEPDKIQIGLPFSWLSTTHAATTRTNLGIPLPALTNTTEANFRTAIGLGSAATNASSAFQPASSILTNLSSGNGSSITNVAASGLTGVVSVSQGGTGANNQASARSALGLGGGITGTRTFIDSNSVTNSVTISNGIITSWTQN